MCNFYESIVHRKNFEVSLFKKVFEYLFDQNLNFEDKGNILMVDRRKLTMNSLHGQSMRRDVDEEYNVRSKN